MSNVRLCAKGLVSTHTKENMVPMVGRGIPMPQSEICTPALDLQVYLRGPSALGTGGHPTSGVNRDSFQRHLTVCVGSLPRATGNSTGRLNKTGHEMFREKLKVEKGRDKGHLEKNKQSKIKG